MAASTDDQLAALRNANRVLREALEWVARNARDPKARTVAEEALLDREPAAVHPHEIDGEWFI